MQSSRTWFRHFAGASTALALLASSLPAPAQPAEVTPIQSPSERADQLHREAKVFLEKKNWEDALPKLREAYSLKPSYDIVTNLGWTLSAMEQHLEAAQRMCEAIDKFPTDVDRRAFDNVYDDARSRIGTARVLLEDPHVTIVVDDRPAQVCIHDQARIVFVMPGQHTFVAERDGRRSDTVSPSFEPGKEVLVNLGPLHDGPPAPQPNGDDDAAAIAGAWSGIAVGALATIIGGGLLGAWAVTKSDARDLRNEIVGRSGSACPGGDPACDDLRKKVENEARFHNAGLPLVIGGGAALAIATVTLIVAMNDADEADTDDAKIQLLPIVGGHTYGIGVTGQF